MASGRSGQSGRREGAGRWNERLTRFSSDFSSGTVSADRTGLTVEGDVVTLDGESVILVEIRYGNGEKDDVLARFEFPVERDRRRA